MRLILALLCFMVVSSPAWALTPAMIGAVSHAGCPTHGTDWSTWTGTNNGSVVEDYLGTQEWNTGVYAPIDANTSLHVYSTTNDPVLSEVNYRLESAIVTMDANCKTLSRGTPTVLNESSSGFGLPNIAKMSDTRYVVINQDWGGSNELAIRVLDQNGAQIAFASAGVSPVSSRHYVASHSATAFTVAYSGAANDLFAIAGDITGDTISLGAAVELQDLTTINNPGIVAQTATRGLACGDSTCTRYTLSGTAITDSNNLSVDSLCAAWDVCTDGTHRVLKIATNTFLSVIKPSYGGATGRLKAGVFTDDGTTMTRLDSEYVTTGSVSVALKADYVTEVRPYQSGVQSGLYLVSYTDASSNCGVNLISWDGTNIAIERETVSSSSVTACEHVLVSAFGNGLVVNHWQDDVYWDWKVLSP